VNANTFNLATSYANALVPTAINTTGSQSGVHSLLFNPYGISGASNFLLPDSRAAFLRGSGTSALFTANVTTGQGHYANDKFQGHKIETTSQFWTYLFNGSPESFSIGSGGAFYGGQRTFGSNNQTLITDGTNGTPRTGNETAGKSLGVRYIIKY
jgi:hypothetical protein